MNKKIDEKIWWGALLVILLMANVALQIESNGCFGDCSSCDCDFTGRSYMAIRPPFQSCSPELISAFRYDRADEPQGEQALQFVLFGGNSVKSHSAQRYFTPFCKTELIVDEQPSNLAPGPMDIRSVHFNIFTQTKNFRSKISLHPRQSTVGVGLYYRRGFWRNELKDRQWFASVSAPIVHTRNEMRLIENIINDGGGPDLSQNVVVVGNVVEAFGQKDWVYGKIVDGKVRMLPSSVCALHEICTPYTKTGLADIEAKVGIEWLVHNPCHIESYLGILIPTGNKAESKVLFEPIIGHGSHFGVFCGGSLGAQLWASSQYDRNVRVELTSHSQYLFKNRQIRSFDLKGKPWARYMQMYKDKAQALTAMTLPGDQATNFSTPGINILTRPVEVTPGFSQNGTIALVVNVDERFQGEVGYNLYCRQPECVKLACPWVVGPALKAAFGQGQTNRVRNITGDALLEDIAQAIDEYENNQIQQSDLDFGSAAQPGIVTYMLYGALGCRWDKRQRPIIWTVGTSYEFLGSARNGALDRWLLWGKFGVSF